MFLKIVFIIKSEQNRMVIRMIIQFTQLLYKCYQVYKDDIGILGSIIPKLQNRVTHYDVTNRVANSKIFFFLNFTS